MAIHNIKFDGHQQKLIFDYSYTKQVPFIDKRYDFELGREIEFRNYKAEKAKGTYEIAYSVASELNLIEVEALQKVCEAEKCKHHPCKNGGYDFCDYPHCDQYEQGEAEVCQCTIPNTTMETPHRCIKCNKPIDWQT